MAKLTIAIILLLSFNAHAELTSEQAQKVYDALPGFAGYARIARLTCAPVEHLWFNPGALTGHNVIEYKCEGAKSKLYFEGYLAQLMFNELPAVEGHKERISSFLCGPLIHDPTRYACGVTDLDESNY